MIDRNSVHPLGLYAQMVDNLDDPYERLHALLEKAQEKLSEKEFHSWLCFAYGALIVCVSGLGNPDNIEKTLEERIICQDCNGSGYVGIDTGGGNTRTTFCKCPKGQELLEADEKAREANI